MELLLLAASIIITGAVFLWLLRVIKATLRTALFIAAIVFALQFFGIGSDRILAQMQHIFRDLWRLIPGQHSFDFDGVIQIGQVAYAVLKLLISA